MSNISSRALTETEIAALATPARIAAYRGSYGVWTDEQLHQVIDLRNRLVEAHNELLEQFGPGGFAECLTGLSAGIDELDAVITPTGYDVLGLEEVS